MFPVRSALAHSGLITSDLLQHDPHPDQGHRLEVLLS